MSDKLCRKVSTYVANYKNIYSNCFFLSYIMYLLNTDSSFIITVFNRDLYALPPKQRFNSLTHAALFGTLSRITYVKAVTNRNTYPIFEYT